MSDELTDHDWLQLEMAAAGCTSGIGNWPHLREAVRKVVAARRAPQPANGTTVTEDSKAFDAIVECVRRWAPYSGENRTRMIAKDFARAVSEALSASSPSGGGDGCKHLRQRVDTYTRGDGKVMSRRVTCLECGAVLPPAPAQQGEAGK